MLNNLAAKIFGSRNDRIIKQYRQIVEKINSLEKDIHALSDDQLKEKTAYFKEQLRQGKTLDDILAEAFAVVREASCRVLQLRHFDVQLIGGIVLHEGRIAEMRTGEGKTLVATLPIYLNALTGNGVHLVTVNDYLAKRDGEELGKLYSFLGMTTGIVVSGMDNEQKKIAYQSDITYGTNNEFGFDYLRSNLALTIEDRLQRQLNFAIVDEVDSILIDEARTPLIISGASDVDSELYARLNTIIPLLAPQLEEDGEGDFAIDEKTKQVGLTDSGHDHVEKLLRERGLLQSDENFYNPQSIGLFHHLNACLRAHNLYHKDVDYVVRDDEIVIVDEFTGRTMEGRRWSEGLHQAIEAKEGVSIKQETQTLASITYQNFFRLYDKLAGMTGTADTEAFEFQDVYGLETVVVPTNRPVARNDYSDLIYLNQNAKYRAIIEDVRDCQQRGQPVLLGTASIETSELVSKLLRKEGIKHNVLNAKHHAREAEIIAHAGRPSMVTIATNMAGRGTDIVLGGSVRNEINAQMTQQQKDKLLEQWQKDHQQVVEAGGLHVIGAERHESRRIDNQLRGRSGRQGDPGSSRFYVALDDNLVRIYAGERIKNIMSLLGLKEEDSIESARISKQIESTQKKVEAHNFDARKNLLEYDDVANEQRKVIYSQRSQVMEAASISDMVSNMRTQVIDQLVENFIGGDQPKNAWDIKGLENSLYRDFAIKADIETQWFADNPNLNQSDIKERIIEALALIHEQKTNLVGVESMNRVEKYIALQTIDSQWKQHLTTMDTLRQAIWLRSRAQKDPKREFQREAFEMFKDLLHNIQMEIVSILARIQFQAQEQKELELQAQQKKRNELAKAQYSSSTTEEELKPPLRRELSSTEMQQTRRNELCPCGSQKKFKHCHGKLN